MWVFFFFFFVLFFAFEPPFKRGHAVQAILCPAAISVGVRSFFIHFALARVAELCAVCKLFLFFSSPV